MSDIPFPPEVSIKEKIGFQQKIEGYGREKATSAVEKVNPQIAWEKFRKPQLLELFTKEGFEEPTKAVGVVKYLEETLYHEERDGQNSQKPKRRIPYHFSPKDCATIRQVTKGVEDPFTLLTVLSNAREFGSSYFLPELGNYVEEIKNAPHIHDILAVLPTLGPLEKLRYFNFIENGHYDKLGEPIEDPLKKIAFLPDEKYEKLTKRENLDWVRSLNLQLLDKKRKKFPERMYPILSMEELPQLLQLAANPEAREMFYKVLVESTAQGNESSERDLNRDIVAFVRLQEVYPEVVALYKSGFAIEKKMTENTPFDADTFVEQYKKYEGKIKELGSNQLYLKNARMLAEYGLRPDPFQIRWTDLETRIEVKHLYEVEDSAALQKSLEIFKNSDNQEQDQSQFSKEWEVQRVLKRVEWLKEQVALCNVTFDAEHFVSKSGEITSLGIEALSQEYQKDFDGYYGSIINGLLTENALEQMSPEDKLFWGIFKNTQQYHMVSKTLLEKRGDDELIQDGKPGKELFRLLIAEVHDENLAATAASLLLQYPEVYSPEQQSVLSYLEDMPVFIQKELFEHIPHFPEVTNEEFAPFKKRLEIIQLVNNSPSKEIRRLQKELSAQLWEVEDPAATFAQIEEVFIKNNLPLVGKVYRVFEIIHDNPNNNGQTLLDTKLRSSHLSPVLREGSNRERRETVYKDLLHIHIESSNPSLRKFTKVLQEGQQLIDTMGEVGDSAILSQKEQQQLHYFLDKMDTLYMNSLFGKTIEQRKRERGKENYHGPSTHELPLSERVKALKKNYRVRSGQSITDRVAEMFVYPAGFSSLEEVTAEMTRVKEAADQRNRKLGAQGVIALQAGDLLKGTESVYLDNILQNGSVAKEFLGADSNSDATPLDTDVAMVLPEETEKSFQEIVTNSLSRTYGDITFVIKDRGQFNREDGYELFQTGVLGESHYGIRTGFSSAEIDAIIIKNPDENGRYITNRGLTIARNGFYIPLTDINGKVIFTPEQYDQYRQVYAGVPEFSDEPMEMLPLEEVTDISQEVMQQARERVNELVDRIRVDEGKVDQMEEKIREKIVEVLALNGIKLKDMYETSIFGAQLLNTGSTGRHTNKPGDHDFDLSLLLDARDMPRMGEIVEQVRSSLQSEGDDSHSVTQDTYQIKLKGVQVAEEHIADIDIGVTNRADTEYVASHDVVESKLLSIRERYGEERYYEVLANIVLAKQVLAKGQAYKKLDGGFGGIGTENWILQNKGNFLEACKTFINAAYEDNQRLSFDDFKKRYPIFSAGVNLRNPEKSENFIENMKEVGYTRTLDVLSSYVQTRDVLSYA